MRLLKCCLLVIVILMPNMSFGIDAGSANFENEELTSRLPEMTFSELDSLVSQLFDDPANTDISNENKRLINREYLKRIKSNPDTCISLAVLQDKTQDPVYRQYLFYVYGGVADSMEMTTCLNLITTMRMVFSDNSENEAVRIAALDASDEFIQSARVRGAINENQINELTGLYMDIIGDSVETGRHFH